ncbi:MAG: hypothetical protein ACYS8W_10850 [Planctomycetota bacterium]
MVLPSFGYVKGDPQTPEGTLNKGGTEFQRLYGITLGDYQCEVSERGLQYINQAVSEQWGYITLYWSVC